MSPAGSLRLWVLIHKWSSLVCTAFLLVVCLTGLPLIFREDIEDWLSPRVYAELGGETLMVSLDRVTAAARDMFPEQIVTSIFIDDDEPQIVVSMAPSWDRLNAEPKSQRSVRFDARTAAVLEQSAPASVRGRGFFDVVLHLHTDLFGGLAGQLFLAAMTLLFVVAIVSGVVLYGPFGGKAGFGTVRANGSQRLKWLDLHNLLGITTVVWALVVGVTGAINEISAPLYTLWQRTNMPAELEKRSGAIALEVPETGSVQVAFDAARQALPHASVSSISLPGARFGGPAHYMFWMKGNTALTGRLFTPVLVDARTGTRASIVQVPWYLKALQISRPLHFGDYGGMPLKFIWAMLDVVLMSILISGLYLFLAGRRPLRESHPR